MKIVQQNMKESVSHIKFDLSTLVLNQNTSFDLFIKKDKNFLIIIEKGTLISQKILSLLQKQTEVFIKKEDKYKQTLSYTNLHTYLQSNLELKEVTMSFLYKVVEKQFEHMFKYEKVFIDMNFVNSFVSDIIYLVQSDTQYLKKAIAYFSNDYSIAIHSLHIAIYAIHIANQLHLDNTEMQEIGTAGLLHDVGIHKINQKILYKSTELTKEEEHIVQEHPKLGIAILEHNHIHNPYILDAIMHHHERYDGTGYPNHLQEKQISKYASILAICDVFDALTNNRPYREKYSSFEALQMMIKDPKMQNSFNRKYLRIFLKSLT
jgi:HD-GYP domain-containing protein (c-di-GMP phosphodiesterase class II)